jgi:hypothetical protein
MDTKSDNLAAPVAACVSLVRGGLFFHAQEALGLIRPNKWNLIRRFVVLIAISWLPLLVITAIANPGGLHSFFMDDRVHARLLVAIPVLLAGEAVMDVRFHAVLAYLYDANLLEGPDQSRMDAVLATMGRLRDAYLPEIIILALIYIRILVRYRALLDTTPWLGQVVGAGYHFTAAGWYALFVSAPLWSFMLALALWRWLLWSYFAFQLSRQNLQLVASHPDKRGGLGFLSLMIWAFAVIAFAANSAIAATWRYNILRHGAHLMSYKLYALVLIAVLLFIALAPLVAFVPRLVELRVRGIVDHGVLGQIHSAHFNHRWVVNRAGHEGEFLVAPEINTLSGFSNVYEKVGDLRPFPADLSSLVGLVIAMVVPAIFVLMTQIPLVEILKDLLGTLR